MTIHQMKILAWAFEVITWCVGIYAVSLFYPIAERLMAASTGDEWWIGMAFFLATAFFVFRSLVKLAITAGGFAGAFFLGVLGWPPILHHAEASRLDAERDYGY